jgi:peptidyl-prolyl cis-trans isomerase B (cyclophilin B)
MPRPRERASAEHKPRRAEAAKPRRVRPARGPRPALGHQAARILALAAALAAAAGCAGESDAPAPLAREARVSDGPHEVAVLRLQGLGEIRIELLPELAPKTVAHWKSLAAAGVYDGTSFHRVIPGFVIQGGDPNTRDHDPRDDGQGGSEFTVPDEFTSHSQRRGTVSMAHRGHPNTAGSQFFILHGDAPFLDGHYTAFGRVMAGMDVVDAVAALEIDKYGRFGPRDRPYPKPALIESVKLLPPAAAAAPLAASPAPPPAPERELATRPAPPALLDPPRERLDPPGRAGYPRPPVAR